MREDIVILKGNAVVKDVHEPVYEWEGRVDEDCTLFFQRAFVISSPDFEGISNLCFRVHKREFKDLSFLKGRTLQMLSGKDEIRKHEDGTRFLFSYSNIPTFDFGDRVWDSMCHIAVYADDEGINMIHCRHGYAIPRIKVYIGLTKSIPAFTELLEKLGCADQMNEKEE